MKSIKIKRLGRVTVSMNMLVLSVLATVLLMGCAAGNVRPTAELEAQYRSAAGNMLVSVDKKSLASEADTHDVLARSLAFLVENFGTPSNTDRVLVQVSPGTEPSAHTRMGGGGISTKIVLNDYHITRMKGHPYVVHELFHAFYETAEWRRTVPPFLKEALASYAEQLYRYRHLDRKEAYRRIKSKFDLLSCNSEPRVDYNRSVAQHATCERKMLYLQGALMFYSMEEAEAHGKIARTVGNPPEWRVSFLKWAEETRVALNAEVFPNIFKGVGLVASSGETWYGINSADTTCRSPENEHYAMELGNYETLAGALEAAEGYRQRGVTLGTIYENDGDFKLIGKILVNQADLDDYMNRFAYVSNASWTPVKVKGKGFCPETLKAMK